MCISGWKIINFLIISLIYNIHLSVCVSNDYMNIYTFQKTRISDFFKKKGSLFGQKISNILCLVFDFICIYYIESDY